MNDLDSYQSPFDKPVVNIPSADLSGILLIGFFLIFVIWAIYTIVAGYHWFRYGHRSWMAIPAMVMYVAVSAICILIIATGV